MKKIVIICLLLLLVGCNNKKNEPEIQYNNEEKINYTLEFEEGITITVESFYYDGTYSNLDLLISNNSDKIANLGYFDIIVYDENGGEIGKFLARLDDDILSNSSVSMQISVDENFIDGHSIEYDLTNLEMKDSNE